MVFEASTGFMKRRTTVGLVSLAGIIGLALIGAGCPTGQDLPAAVLNPNVDLVVVDAGISTPVKDGAFDANFPGPKILLYDSVLTKNSLQDPSLIFTTEFLSNPVSAQLTGDFTGNDLYVADNGSDTVLIWRDYRDLSLAKGAPGVIEPDVVLDCSHGVFAPFEILDVDNRLYVSNGGLNKCKGPGIAGSVVVFDHAGAIESGNGDEPVLDFLVSDARGIAVANDTLYVATPETLFKDTIGDTGAVVVFEGIAGRIEEANSTKGGPTNISVVLEGPSFLNIDHADPIRVDVFGSRLYVTTELGILFVFNNADALVDFQDPAAVIAPTTGTIGFAGDMKMLGDTLYIGSLGEQVVKAGQVGMTGFRPGHAITSGQNSVLAFDATNSQIPSVTGLAAEDEVLFAATQSSQFNFPTGDVHIFDTADTLAISRPADLVLPALRDFALPACIDSNTFVAP